jgi:hypothetical protein
MPGTGTFLWECTLLGVHTLAVDSTLSFICSALCLCILIPHLSCASRCVTTHAGERFLHDLSLSLSSETLSHSLLSLPLSDSLSLPLPPLRVKHT